MPAGRPTNYNPELGEQIIALMEQGLSLAAAAGELGVHRRRVYDWKDRHPEFAELVDIAMVKRQAFLEKRLLDLGSAGPHVTAAIFALKNAAAADWREKQEIEHSGGTNNTVSLAGLTVEQLEAIAAAGIDGAA